MITPDSRPLLWILWKRIPLPCDDLRAWGRFMASPDRIVAQTEINPEACVSTVFLGLDHGFSSKPDAPPVLFETMVFGEERVVLMFGREVKVRDSLDQRRFATWEEAEEGHRATCARIEGEFNKVAAFLNRLRTKQEDQGDGTQAKRA